MQKETNSLRSPNNKGFAATRAESFGNEQSFSESFPEIEDIRRDWQALKEDVAKLTTHAHTDGGKHIKKMTKDAVEKVERHVVDRPVQSLGIAFLAGLGAYLLLGRR